VNTSRFARAVAASEESISSWLSAPKIPRSSSMVDAPAALVSARTASSGVAKERWAAC
jgi:hypothetical protein